MKMELPTKFYFVAMAIKFDSLLIGDFGNYVIDLVINQSTGYKLVKFTVKWCFEIIR